MRTVPTSGDPDPLWGASPRVDEMRRVTTFRHSESIYAEWDSAAHWYCVISGAAANYVMFADGRRRIVDFLLPGDYFGFSPWPCYRFGAEALSEGTTVACYPCQPLEAIIDDEPRMAGKIRKISFQCLTRSQARLLTLGSVTSLGKVASFLTEMARRSADDSTNTVELPMSRYDIADYLAISVETVSRAFSVLKRRGAIHLYSVRRVQILDAKLLNEGFDRPGSTKRPQFDTRPCIRHSPPDIDQPSPYPP